MEICRNKKSGRWFILLDENINRNLVLITPECKPKTLESHLFDEPEEDDRNTFLNRGFISKSQIDAYDLYIKYRKHDGDELVKRWLNRMSKWERNLLIKRFEQILERRKKFNDHKEMGA